MVSWHCGPTFVWCMDFQNCWNTISQNDRSIDCDINFQYREIKIRKLRKTRRTRRRRRIRRTRRRKNPRAITKRLRLRNQKRRKLPLMVIRAEPGHKPTTKWPSPYLTSSIRPRTSRCSRKEQMRPLRLSTEVRLTWLSWPLTPSHSRLFFTCHFCAKIRTYHTFMCQSRPISAELVASPATS